METSLPTPICQESARVYVNLPEGNKINIDYMFFFFLNIGIQ